MRTLTQWLGDPSTCHLISTAWLFSLAVRGLLHFCTRCLGVGDFLSVPCPCTPWTLEPPVAQGYALVSAHVCKGRGGGRRVFLNPAVLPKCVPVLHSGLVREWRSCVRDAHSKGTRRQGVAWPAAISSQGCTAGAALKEGFMVQHVGGFRRPLLVSEY